MIPNFLELENEIYPTGKFTHMGENLRVLTRDASNYTPPVYGKRANCPIIVPTRRNVIRYRKDIRRIMHLAHVHGSNFVIFLCSGPAKKDDIANIAKRFPGLKWLAVEGDFFHDPIADNFKTTHSVLSYGTRKDISQKRNVALQLARMMGWESIFFLDDDISLVPKYLDKVSDLLLRSETQVVGFSARKFHDSSVFVSAYRWVNDPVDSFIGSGAMAIKTNSPLLSFFPHVYNEDWLFLLIHCLTDASGVVWAGVNKQRKFNPYKNPERAKIEEPGDLLAESLFKLVMQIKSAPEPPTSVEEFIQTIVEKADVAFWEDEINKRIALIRLTIDKLDTAKYHPLQRRRAKRSLDEALGVLIGRNGVGGIRAVDLASWVSAWADDLRLWQKHQKPVKVHDHICDAVQELGYTNFIYNEGMAYCPEAPHEENTQQTQPEAIPNSLLPPANAPRDEHISRCLQNTKIFQDYLNLRDMDLGHVAHTASRLRFDRPTAAIADLKPSLTICMFVMAGEAPSSIRQSAKDLVEYADSRAPIQLVVWVCGDRSFSTKAMTSYRDTLVAHLMPLLTGTNIWLRSGIIAEAAGGIDHVIDSALVDLAFAYWKYDVSAEHRVFAVNSSNEPLRWGTFWQFMQQEHKVPTRSLQSYVQETLAKGNNPKNTVLSPHDDEIAMKQSRGQLSGIEPSHHSGTQSRRNTARMTKAIRQAGLDWLRVDELAFQFNTHETRKPSAPPDIKEVGCLAYKYTPNLLDDVFIISRAITEMNSKREDPRQPYECLIAVYDTNNASWQQLSQCRAELMHHLHQTNIPESVSLTSFICKGKSTKSIELQINAVSLYMHWLDNDRLPVKIRTSFIDHNTEKTPSSIIYSGGQKNFKR